MRNAAASLVLVLTLGLQAQETKPPITFTKDIAPIVFHHCAACHRPGEAGPFPLLEYGDVKKRAKQLLAAVESRQMPPWKPVEGYGEFAGERRMKPAEIDLFKSWVEKGCAEGDAKDLPHQPKFSDGWLYGEPDHIVTMPIRFSVPAEGQDIVRAFVTPVNLPENKYVRAVQILSDNKRVVHHAVLFTDPSSESRKKDEADPEPGFEGWKIGLAAITGGTLGTWLPGGPLLPFPDGMAKEVKKNADLVLQMHYNPIGKVVEEQSRIGLWFSKELPRRMVVPVPLFNVKIDLPPGEKDLQVADKYILPVDVDVIGVSPHAHYLGKECKIWAKTPDGKEIPIIWIKNWDFDWQEQYRCKEMIRLPKDSEVNMIWTFDNTSSNPKNPSNPPQRVRHGERSKDEMAVAGLQVATFNAGDKMKLYLNLLTKPTVTKEK